jgi:predicted nucleotidyltransferase
MAYTKDEAITVIRAFLEKIRLELPIERAYLFGSYATGRSRDYSDIDLAIVTPVLNAENSIVINQKIFSRASRYNVDLEPICFSPEEFEKEELPIVLDIKRTGIEITVTNQ